MLEQDSSADIAFDTDLVLRVNEIFYSLQGESTRVGLPTTFIRLTGCPLRCQYCDTAYAFSNGQSMTIAQIIAELKRHASPYVTVTGGEPLAQKSCFALLRYLCDCGFLVSIETSGAIDLAAIDQRVMKVMDIKTPGSGEMDKTIWTNLECLMPSDQIKLVLCGRADYKWACQMLTDWQLTDYCEVLFSPAHGQLLAVDLAEWILADNLPVRLQIQLHKYLWGDVAGR